MTANHSLFNHKVLLAAPGIHAFDKFSAYLLIAFCKTVLDGSQTFVHGLGQTLTFFGLNYLFKKNACISITSLEDRDGVPCQSKGQVDDGYR